jgi:hypothetical protein
MTPPTRPYSPQRLFSTKQTNRPSGGGCRANPTRSNGPAPPPRHRAPPPPRTSRQDHRRGRQDPRMQRLEGVTHRERPGQRLPQGCPRHAGVLRGRGGAPRGAGRAHQAGPAEGVVGGLQRHARCSPGRAGGRGRPDSRVRGNGGPWPAADRGLHPRADQGGPARRLPGTDRTMGSLPHDPAGPAQAACSPYLHVVIEECALRRAVGGPSAMRRQLQHLLEVGTCPT